MLLNFYFFYFIIFVSIMLMYFFHLSSLYHSSVFFNVILLCIMCANFSLSFVFYFFSLKDLKLLNKTLVSGIFLKNSGIQKSKIRKFAFLFFFIGLLSSIYIYEKSGLLFFKENKVSYELSSPILHYMNYFRNFLGYAIPLLFFLYKITPSRERKFYLILMIISFVILSLSLRRGELFFPLLSITFIEYIFHVKSLRKKLFYVKITIIIIIFLMIFSFFGNLRVEYVMEHVFKTTVQEFYGMNNNYPAWFVWIYIYTTSPLENLRHIIEDQQIANHSFGLLIFSPFFQPLFKIFGSNINNYRQQVYPYLDEIAGLNVSTFVQDAIIDFSYFGIFIYLLIFYTLLFLSLKRSYKNLFGFLSYIMAFNIILWSMFVNSLSVGPFVIGFMLFYILSFPIKVRLK